MPKRCVESLTCTSRCSQTFSLAHHSKKFNNFNVLQIFFIYVSKLKRGRQVDSGDESCLMLLAILSITKYTWHMFYSF